MRYLPHILSALLLTAACTGTPQEEEVQVPGASVTFLTGIEETKAGVAEDFSAFKWEAGDRITVLDGISAVEYSTKESGAQVLFTSDKGIADGVKRVFAAFPVSADAHRSTSGIVLTVPSAQSVDAPGMDLSAAPMVAYADNPGIRTPLLFRSICSYFKFTVPSSDNVVSVTLKGGEGEYLAGRIDVKFEKGIPVFEVIDGTDQIDFSSSTPMNGVYVIPLLPVTLSEGLEVTLRSSDGRTAIHKVVAKDENDVISAIEFRRDKVNHFTLSFSDPVWREAPVAEALSVSSSTAAFRFTENAYSDPEKDFAGHFSVGLYKDNACGEPVKEIDWQLAAVSNIASPAFCFTGLEPSTDYWFRVLDVQTQVSGQAVKITTGPSSVKTIGGTVAEGEIVLMEDFSELTEGGDPVNKAWGIIGEELSATPSTLPEWSGTDLSSTRLAAWAEKTPGAEYVGPGYIRVGDSSSQKDAVMTPVLSNLGECATVKVEFRAAPFSSDYGVGNGASRLGECYAEVWVVNGEQWLSAGIVELTDDPTQWSSCSVEAYNVLPTSRIAIGGAYGEKTKTSGGKQYGRIYLDDVTLTAVKYEQRVAVIAPELTLGNVFWSDVQLTWTCSGEPEAYKVYVDGEVRETLGADVLSYHLTGLESGSRHSVSIAAVYNGARDEGASAAQYFTTGTVERLTKNLSPTSLAFGIENRAGDNTNNNNPLIEVELLDGPDPASAKSVFRSYVIDGQILSPGTPYFASLMVSDKKSRAPLNVAIGCLEPGTDYWFRVRSVETLTFTSYQTSTPATQTVTSSNGTSEFSLPVKATTPPVHTPESGEVLFEGFDCLMVQADYVNLAVGTMPAYKKAGKAASAMSYKTVKEWDGDWSFYGLRNAYGSTQLAPQYAWAAQQTADNEMFKLSAQNGNGTIKGAAGTVPGIGAKIYTFKESAEVSGSLSGWLSTNSTYAGQGYIQLGAYYNASDAVNNLLGMIVTPELTKGLSKEAAACVLSFKGLVLQGRDCALGIWKYSSGTWTKLSDIALYNSAGSTSVATVWSGEADTHTWYPHSLNIELKAGDRLALEAPKAAGAVLMDDIQIKLQ